jgi:uncharacterized protein (DUF2267 family)
MIAGDALLEEVIWRGGIQDRSNAKATIEAALEALAEHLAPADARLIAEQLPAAFAAALARRRRPALGSPSDLHARLAASEGISLGLAVEHARAAGAAIAESVDSEGRSLLARRLPPEWAALFAPTERAPEHDIPPGTMPGHGHTLATGRPGSPHALAEAGPRSAQADSVLTAANPHADRKLSSADDFAGSNRLATARPDAESSIADAKDGRRRR